MSERTNPKWTSDGLYVWDDSIVGTVSYSPNGLWYACGCEDEWQDVRLGSFRWELDARKAVEKWVREHCS